MKTVGRQGGASFQKMWHLYFLLEGLIHIMVTVYSLPTARCVACRATEISLRRKGIEAKKVMVDTDEVAMDYIKSLGYAAAPVVVITDDDGLVVDSWSGFSEAKIEELKEKVAA